MPYKTIEALTAAIRARLPEHAQEVFRATFNNAWMQYADKDPAAREQTAHRVAWAAVKRKYRKQGEYWVAR